MTANRFRIITINRNGSAQRGDAFETLGAADTIAQKILQDDAGLIEVHVVEVLSTFAKEFRIVKA